MSVKQRGLGKGLGALIGANEPEKTADVSFAAAQASDNAVVEINILDIDPNIKQARKQFDRAALESLSNSISIHGVIQPIILSKAGNRYRIIAGERRWRAAKIAGIDTIPAIITKLKDEDEVEVSLIENLQREDLNPLEEAAGIKYLIEEYSLTQERAAKRLCKSRSAIANALRLLTLPETVQDYIWSGELSAGHARALAGITDKSLQEEMARKAIEQDLSVRKMEALKTNVVAKKNRRVKKRSISPELYDMQESLQHRLGTKVIISGNDDRGKITIEYYSSDDIEGICELLLQQ